MFHRIDGLNTGMRKLVYEFGWVIVRNMLDDGFTGTVGELFDILVVWRERRQEQWLATDYITKSTRDTFMSALTATSRSASIPQPSA